MEELRQRDRVSYYAILNVPPGATDAEIKRAYRSLAQTFHPDKHPTAALRKDAADGFALINEAYEVPLASPQLPEETLWAGVDESREAPRL